MRQASAVFFLVASVAAGCAALPLQGELAEVPSREDAPFLVMSWACGMQPYPVGDVLVTLSNGTLHHIRVESDMGEARQAENASRPIPVAEFVLQAANRTGGFNLTRYHAYSGSRGHVIMHAEARDLTDAEFRNLRARMAAADFPGLADHHPQDTPTVDGCSYAYAAWTGDGYRAVTAIDDGGPPRLDRLRVFYHGLHAS